MTGKRTAGFLAMGLVVLLGVPAFALNGVVFIHGTGDYTQATATSDYWTQASIDGMRGGRRYLVVGYQGASCAAFSTCSWGPVTDQIGAWASANSITDIVVVAHSNGSNVVRYMLAHQGAWTGSRYVSSVTSKFRKVVFVAGDNRGTILADKVTSSGTLASIGTAVWSFFGGSDWNNPGVWQQVQSRMATYNSNGTFGGTAGASTISGVPARAIAGTSVYAAVWSGDAYCGGYSLTTGLKAALVYGWGYYGCSDGFIGCASAKHTGTVVLSDSRLNHNQSRRKCRATSAIASQINLSIGYAAPPPDYVVSPAAQACNAAVGGVKVSNYNFQGCPTHCASFAACTPVAPGEPTPCADGSECTNRYLPWYVAGYPVTGHDCMVAYGLHGDYVAQDVVLDESCPTTGQCPDGAECTEGGAACAPSPCPTATCADGTYCDAATPCADGSACTGGGVCEDGSACTADSGCASPCSFTCRDGTACEAGAASACTNGVNDAYNDVAYSAFSCPDTLRGNGRCDFCIVARYGYDAAEGQDGADDCVRDTGNICVDIYSKGSGVYSGGAYCEYHGKCVRDSDGYVTTATCGSPGPGCTSYVCSTGYSCVTQ